MSENSPRWPGRDGGPGLDFSPYRTDEPKPEAPAAEPKADDTQVSASARPEDAAAPTKRPATVSQRAANTAKEWAAVPVAGRPVAPADAEPVATKHPATPPRTADVRTAGGLEFKAEPAEATTAATATAVSPAKRRTRRTRKARLRLSRIDPWSVMKTTFLFSIAFGIMLVVATAAVWSVLAGSGAMESANTLVNTILGDAENSANSFRLEDYLTTSRVLGFATVLAAVDVVIITAVATLFAFLYNLAATVMGGLEVTLAED